MVQEPERAPGGNVHRSHRSTRHGVLHRYRVSGAPELNYYYYMASQFALSDRWFSPVSSKSTPNRLATLTGGTTQGLVRDPFTDDKLPALSDRNHISGTGFRQSGSLVENLLFADGRRLRRNGRRLRQQDESEPVPRNQLFGFHLLREISVRQSLRAACVPPTVGSSAVGDHIEFLLHRPTHIAPLKPVFHRC